MVAGKARSGKPRRSRRTSNQSPAKDSARAVMRSPSSPAFNPRRGKACVEDVPPLTYINDANEEMEVAALPDPQERNIQWMMADMVEKLGSSAGLDAQEIFDAWPEVLRVGTVCSGTEAPLLAMRLIAEALGKLPGRRAPKIDHVFSCEIEPFKQAYIERNFKPPILFRDLRQLPQSRAETAYGQWVDVPGGLDILVAGTSCVDFSNLNNEKKGLDDHGQSGETFMGMIGYIKRYKPKLLVLENVCSAPWPRMKEMVEKAGYTAGFLRLDTKKYYIPQTRQRGYLAAFHNSLLTARQGTGCAGLGEKWVDMMNTMERPMTTVVEDFLLHPDDPRAHHARQQMLRRLASKGKEHRAVDWKKCEERSLRVRVEEDLGNGRPYTGWQMGGVRLMPDFAPREWAEQAPDRTMELVDINYLRLAKMNIDARYRSDVWNISQNVDMGGRGSGKKTGQCCCVTPHGIFFLANRGAPMTGLEMLELQGIPTNVLRLTRESEDQLHNLAGNAMTTTVVASAMVGALVLSKPKGAVEDRKKRKVKVDRRSYAGPSMECPASKPMPARTMPKTLKDLLPEAITSASYCQTEGPEGIAQYISQCAACGHTASEAGQGWPEHDFKLMERTRTSPVAFEEKVKNLLPPWIRLNGISDASFKEHKAEFQEGGANLNLWKEWLEALHEELGDFSFQGIDRNVGNWTIHYSTASERASCDILLPSPSGNWVEWRVYIRPRECHSAALRHLFTQPVATMHDGLDNQWAVRFPVSHRFIADLSGAGDEVETWHASLGLPQQEKEPSEIVVTVKKCDADLLAEDNIAGRYRLLPRCGGPMRSIHRRVDGGGRMRNPPLYLMLEATQLGPIRSGPDRWIFTRSCRLPGSHRQRQEIVAYMPNSSPAEWSPHKLLLHEHQQMQCCRVGLQHTVPAVKMIASTTSNPIMYSPSALSSPDAATSCGSSQLVLHSELRTPLEHWAHEMKLVSQGGGWEPAALGSADHMRSAGGACLGPLMGPLAHLVHPAWELKNWQQQLVHRYHNGTVKPCSLCCDGWSSCPRCSPLAPVEGDGQDVAEYERAMHERPPAFTAWVAKLSEDTIGLRVALNVASLIHRAMSLLPPTRRACSINCQWRLTEYRCDLTSARPPEGAFKLLSNDGEEGCMQPEHFEEFPLRPEQLRSLSWMIRREADLEPYHQEAVVEARLPPPLRWGAEAKAVMSVHIRGGICCDEIGFGKTAVTIGLVDSTLRAKNVEPPEEFDHLIPSRATLVVCPGHLSKQWPSEVQKFVGDSLNVICIQTSKQLAHYTLEDIANADMVIANFTVFESADYTKTLESLAGEKAPAQRGSQAFARWYEKSLFQLRKTSKRARAALPPLLERIYWFRVVYDEVTELKATALEAVSIHGIHAQRKWGLSGTPPVESLEGVVHLASFVGAHLNTDCSRLGAHKSRASTTEEFLFYQQAQSEELHRAQRDAAQSFLDRFARQNLAHIPEIKVEQHELRIKMNPAERAVYRELTEYYLPFDSRPRPLPPLPEKASAAVRRLHGIRSQLLNYARQAATEPELAQLKCCSVFDYGTHCGGDVRKECQKLQELHSDELCHEKERLLKEVQRVLNLARKPEVNPEGPAYCDFVRWKNCIMAAGEGLTHLPCGEIEARAILRKIMRRAELSKPRLLHRLRRLVDRRNQISDSAKATKQEDKTAPHEGPRRAFCPKGGAGGTPAEIELTKALHSLRRRAAEDLIPRVRALKILREETEAQKDTGGYSVVVWGSSGSKMRRISDTLKKAFAEDSTAKALIFVQTRDLMLGVSNWLNIAGVAHTRLEGSVMQKTKVIEDFQQEGGKGSRVLLCTKESACGTNLTSANHVVFVHPMFTSRDRIAEALMYERQAIGRVRRYGQQKVVHIHRCVVEDTFESELIEMQAQAQEVSGATRVSAPITPPDKMIKRKAEAGTPERTPCSTKRGRTPSRLSRSGTFTKRQRT